VNLNKQILIFFDQTGFQNKCNSGKQWFKPENAKNTIIRNPDWMKINAFGSYSPNGESILQFRHTSKTLDMLTFLSETRKVNTDDENTYHELELLINEHYYSQNKIVNEQEGFKYYKKDIINHLLKNKINYLRKKIIPYGNVHLINEYYEVICNYIVENISKNEISDSRILKKVYDKNNRIQGEIALAKNLEKELSKKDWVDKFKKEKEIILILDNATIHQASLTKKLAKSLNINLIYLPKYASDLNSIERLWYTIKREISIEFVEDINYLKQQFQVYFYKHTQTDSLAKNFISEFII
jgi:transposase